MVPSFQSGIEGKMERDTVNKSTDEIEVTPKMIEAGLGYLEDAGLNSFTSRTTYPDFVIRLYRVMKAADRRLPEDSRQTHS